MTISRTKALQAATVINTPISPSAVSPNPPKDFQEAMRECKGFSCLDGVLGQSLHEDLVKMQAQVLKGGSMPARDLLLYQVRVGELNLRIELMSKLADSLLTTCRKLQNGQ
jgi:hypothetical protein